MVLGVPVPILACAVGVLLGFALCFAAVRGGTTGSGAQGDSAQVTTTFTVFGLKVGESTGTWSSIDERFRSFASSVTWLFSIVGGASGLLIGTRLGRPRTQRAG
jgi:hypothetical protein